MYLCLRLNLYLYFHLYLYLKGENLASWKKKCEWLIPHREEGRRVLKEEKISRGEEFGGKIINTKFQSYQSYHKKWLILYRGGEATPSFRIIISPTPTIEATDNEIFLFLRKSFEKDKESKF